MVKTTDSLSEGEQAQLAREVAADKYDHNNPLRDAFIDGWDAALAWSEKQREDQRLDDWQRGYEAGMNGT